ncbi:DUF2235 domain-containing protein [Sphingomonas sp. AOB5]|uniref:T6SS phospholipase effector Tle1-like catalytic domain-containing protein n=1 Tax=Sphingomonas sp. AOB5 TaxID=3034017 RepID=UPI0023F72F96|nr:DUF2235 domain-containing protein [Sphingomonas sp. AOB5]MDF7777254.1 DUF2235 domain-containing protein [Sphingomonas sp. AOB5]
MAKRIAFCFDGTWNKIDGDHPTNVARVAQSISRYDDKGVPQIIYYDEGVGTTTTSRWTGGILGHGLRENIIEAYHFLVLNYEPGDQIYVFGFSRGAYTARSFVGLLRNCGIISRRSLDHIRDAVEHYANRAKEASPNSEASRQFRFKHCPKLCLPGDLAWRKRTYPKASTDLTELRIAYLGVWDTVGALGVPQHLRLLSRLFNRKFAFHDTTLSGVVERARHAVAVDEKRKTFEPALWSNLDELNGDAKKPRYEQFFFPGVHGAVGGGGPLRGLSDSALEWIFHGAEMQDLVFDRDDQSPLHLIRPDPRTQLFNVTGKSKWSIGDRLMGIGLADRRFPDTDDEPIHESLIHRFRTPPDQLPEGIAYRPPSLAKLWEAIDRRGAGMDGQLAGAAPETKSADDDRELRVPDSVRSYEIQVGDTLASIAEAEMGSAADAPLLSLHNRNIGLLFEDESLYPGTRIEIPVYEQGPAAGTVI